MNIKNHDFFLITIRGRVAYSICCIENAVNDLNQKNIDWTEVFDFLWRYPTGNEIKDLALWHENEAEFIPFCVLEEQPYDQKMFEYLSEEQHARFRNVYLNCNSIICEMIDKTAQVATQSLYGGVRDGSPITLKYIDEIINIMNSSKIHLPNLDFFKQFNYQENPSVDWDVWGNCISRELLGKESKWINKTNPIGDKNKGH